MFARVGELEYHELVPSIAPDAGGGLTTTVVREYRVRTVPGASLRYRSRGHTSAISRSSALASRRHPLPPSVILPPADSPRGDNRPRLQHEVLPR